MKNPSTISSGESDERVERINAVADWLDSSVNMQGGGPEDPPEPASEFDYHLSHAAAELRMVAAALATPPAAPAATEAPSALVLHPNTADLVKRFAQALAEKLAAAELKYGYSDGWRSPDWMGECRAKLLEHVAKGDPRDVAAYCAFLWHHNASTATPFGASASLPDDHDVLEYCDTHPGSTFASAVFALATPAPAVGASPEPVKRDEAEHAAWRTDYAKGAAQMLRRWPTPPADAVTDGTSDVRENALARGIRALMRRLASLLDEDQFKDCEDIVRQAGVTPAAPEVDPTAIYSNLGRVAFEAMNPGKVFTYLPAHEMQRWEAAAEAVRMAAPVYAWEATTIGYKRFVTDDWYRKSSDAVKRWYKPFRCSSCAAVPASVQPAAGALPPVRWWSGVVGSPEKLANLLDEYSEKKESPRRDERVMRAAAKWIREVVASVQPVLASLSDAIDGPRYRWLRANREAQAEDGTLLDVYDEDGTMLSHESLDRAIDAALASSTPTSPGAATPKESA